MLRVFSARLIKKYTQNKMLLLPVFKESGLNWQEVGFFSIKVAQAVH